MIAGGDEVGTDRPGSLRRPVLLATSVIVIVTVPVFLASAEAVQIAPAVGLDKGALGLIAAVFFGSTAISSAALGHVIHSWGVRWGFAVTLPSTGIALLGLASSQSVPQLAASMALAGLANGAAQPSVNALLASEHVHLPLGLSLGIKETAAPAASVVAGLAVPALALTVGWRWSCVAGACAAFLLAIVATRAAPRAKVGSAHSAPTDDKHVARGLSPLAMVAIAAGCGAVGGNALGTFLVDYGVRGVHIGEGSAGLVFALASFSGVLVRILLGWIADQTTARQALKLTGILMVAGSTGYGLLGMTEAASFVIAAIFACAVGWSWSPLMHYAVVSANRHSPARVSGILLSGFATGSFAGPLVLGQLAERIGYQWIWVCAAAVNVIGGIILWSVFSNSVIAGDHMLAERPRLRQSSGTGSSWRKGSG